MRNINLIKASCIAIVLNVFLFVNGAIAQSTPTILIDGVAALANTITAAPYWLKANQTLETGDKVNAISVLQYNIAPSDAGGNSLQFESVLSVTTEQTVPSGKAWKIESVALDPTSTPLMQGIQGPAGETGATGPAGPAGPAGIPTGVIILWSGSIASIPSGYALCDGTNGTPDLRDRFVVGAGTSYAVGDTGGEATHVLTIDEMPSHSHNVPANASSFNGSGNAGGFAGGSVATSSTGGGAAHENRPPYYALAYIIKL